MQVHDEYKTLLSAYALDALDAGEVGSFEEHIADCDECRDELDDLLRVCSTIALSVDPIEPPAELRDRILDVARSTPQESTFARAEVKDSRAPEDTNADVNNRPSTNESRGHVVEFASRKNTSSPAVRFFAIAASIACVVALAGLFVVWNRAKQNESQLAEKNRRMQERIREVENQLAKERELSSAFASPNARVAELSGTETAPKATAKFAVDRTSGRAMLMAYNLPIPPPDKEYQLWYIEGGKPSSCGVFKIDSKGNGKLEGVVPKEGMNAAVFAITLEPMGGVSAPTSAIYLKSSA